MSRGPLLLAVVLALALTGAARAERLTVALSTPEVKINSNFTGTAITVFGVIDRDAASVTRTASYDVAVLLLGPSETVVARRKERFLGIWANAASETFLAAPTFYGLSTTNPVDTLAVPAVLDRLQIGFDNITLRREGGGLADDAAANDFRKAFIRLKQRAGLFTEQVGVTFIGDLVFRATIVLPANIPVGAYAAEVYLFSGQSLVARAEDRLVVSKTGIEDTMSSFARNQSLIYGVLCVALALVVGWLGGVIFRRD